VSFVTFAPDETTYLPCVGKDGAEIRNPSGTTRDVSAASGPPGSGGPAPTSHCGRHGLYPH